MRKSNFALRLQPSLLEEARKLAESEGVALNQLINVPKALRILKRACVGNPPMKGDELLAKRGRGDEPAGAGDSGVALPPAGEH